MTLLRQPLLDADADNLKDLYDGNFRWKLSEVKVKEAEDENEASDGEGSKCNAEIGYFVPDDISED